MDGGVLIVLPAQQPDFFRAFAQSVLRGEVNFLCEKRSAERLNLCVDVDVYSRDAYSTDQLKGIVRIAASVAFDLFSKSERCIDVLVSAAAPVATEKNGQQCVKTGMHLVWENLTVDVRTAGVYRDALVQRLELSTLDAPLGGWATAIDSAIAKHGILRMLFAQKIADCGNCKNKKTLRDTCADCLGKGRVDAGRPYKLTAQFIKSENRLEVIPPATSVEAIVDHLTRCSIRTEDAPVALNDIMPAWYENPLLPFITETKGPVSKRARRQLAATLTEGQDAVDGMLDKEQIRGALVKKIEAYIRGVARNEHISSVYKDVDVTQALYAAGRSVIFAKTDSSYCTNTRNEHKSNTVYFEIKQCGEMRQKCFCRCDTTVGRRHGLCSAFKSHPVNVPNRQLDVFFPRTSPAATTPGSETDSDAGDAAAGAVEPPLSGGLRCAGLAQLLKCKKFD